jgi:hypothetical protein
MKFVTYHSVLSQLSLGLSVSEICKREEEVFPLFDYLRRKSNLYHHTSNWIDSAKGIIDFAEHAKQCQMRL